jgi:hypothetical protein
VQRLIVLLITLVAFQSEVSRASGRDVRTCEAVFGVQITSFVATSVTAARMTKAFDRLTTKVQSEDHFAYQTFPVTSMGRHWDQNNSVHHFSEQELEARLLNFRDGLIFLGSNERPLSTTDPLQRLRMGPKHLFADGFWDFIMTADGQIYVTPEGFTIKHTSLSLRANAAAAGRIQIINGRVRKIDNMSGHYFPPAEALAQILFELNKNDVPIQQIRVRDIQEPKKTAIRN